MRRIALSCLGLLAAAACTQTAPGVSRATDQTVISPTTGQQLVLSGEMTTSRIPTGSNTAPRHDLVVRVNGQPAVQGTLVTYGATTLQGAVGSMPVAAACQSYEIAKADRQFNCAITLSGRHVANMAFRATPTGPQPPV